MSASLEGQRLSVLAGIDLTERSRNAFARAVDLARTPGASLSLLHVTSDAMPNQLALAHEIYAGEVLRDLAMKAQAEGAKGVEWIIVRGRDYETIIEEARKTHADVVVIGTHRPSSLVQDMLGTTADRVLRLGGVPVLLVKQEAGRGLRLDPRCGRFLAGLAPRADVRAAAVSASAHRGRDGVRQRAAHASRRGCGRARGRGRGDAAPCSQGLPRGDPARRWVRALEGAIAKVETMVERGWAEDVIVRAAEAEKPDLIVVGTHARGGLQHAVLGSVAEWVLTEAPCDVLAVPPAD